MATMSDESAKKIAESTIKKYNDAGRNALIIICGNNGISAAACSNMNGEDAVEAALNLIQEVAEDSAETIFKDAAKQAKQLKKARKDDAKRKNRA